MISAYHFVGETLRDGRPVPPDGEWLEYDGPLVLCQSGLHASRDPYDALKYAAGNTLCLVDLDGEMIEDEDKVVARRRRIIRRIDASSLFWQYVREYALSVVHLWQCPPVVRQYLETGDELLRSAARSPAYSMACSAVYSAAYLAAGSTAYSAAYSEQRKQFNALVSAAFHKGRAV